MFEKETNPQRLKVNRRQLLKFGVLAAAGVVVSSVASRVWPVSSAKSVLAADGANVTVSVNSINPGAQASLRFNIAATMDISNVIASIVTLPPQLVLIQTTAQIDLIQSGEVRVLVIPIGSSQQTPAGSYKVSWSVSFSNGGQIYTATGDTFVSVGSYQGGGGSSGDGGSSGSSSGDSSGGKSGCFIATAAYGTSQAYQIDILREFRDKVLFSGRAGTNFVKFYYRHSPPLAAFISRHESVRTFVRCSFVEPIVWICKTSAAFWRIK